MHKHLVLKRRMVSQPISGATCLYAQTPGTQETHMWLSLVSMKAIRMEMDTPQSVLCLVKVSGNSRSGPSFFG